MNKIARNVGFGISLAVALVCGYFATLCFLYGVLEGDKGSSILFILLFLGCIAGVFLTSPHRFANSLRKCNSYITDALRSGGKQMLCDIIKWTIIVIIAAIVFAVVYRIAVSSGKITP